MELDKEQLPLFYHHKKKSAAYRIICETYDENVTAIRMCPN